MKKIILATAVAAFLMPAASFAQDATGTMATDSNTMGSTAQTDSGTTASTTPTTDLTGNYTIVNNLATLAATNSYTDAASIQSTIDANPGLAAALESNGITVSEIGAIQVKPNGQVEVYGKGS